MPGQRVELGRVSGAHGVRGWLRVHPYSSDALALLHARRWWLRPPAGLAAPERSLRLVQSRLHGAIVIAQAEGLDDRDQALACKGWSVWVARSDFPPLTAGETYWVDLIGCHLYGEAAGQPALIGEVTGVTDSGAHGILQVACAREGDDGSLVPLLDARGRVREELVPYVAAIVHTVDLPGRRLLSHWPVD